MRMQGSLSDMPTHSAKTAVKAFMGWAMLQSGFRQQKYADKGIVVAFHRVNDSGDSSGLTVSSEMFEKFCRFFARYFEVVPLSKFVERLEKKKPVGGMLAITFDDGYRDNYEVAAPILQQLDLPATFFVTTGFIETETVPFWDKEAGVAFPWMDWEQVASLHRQGFEIGAHTRHHVDLGAITGDAARQEIHGSRFDLESKLGTTVDLFAYPFGRADQLTAQNRVTVAEGGFRCCCSCFGGMNTPATDPFSLQRVAISNWFESPFQFAFELASNRL
jgi:peptidoglycan/xylan/chitin deacetylase (PgdA/CDA1 family)